MLNKARLTATIYVLYQWEVDKRQKKGRKAGTFVVRPSHELGKGKNSKFPRRTQMVTGFTNYCSGYRWKEKRLGAPLNTKRKWVWERIGKTVT